MVLRVVGNGNSVISASLLALCSECLTKCFLPLNVLVVLIHLDEVQTPIVPETLQDDAGGVGIGGVNDHGEMVLSRVVEQFVLVENVVLLNVILGNHHDSVHVVGMMGV